MKGADTLAPAAEDAGRAVTFAGDLDDPEAAREAYRAFVEKVPGLPKKALPAFLPMALVPLWLAKGQTSQFRRQLALMRAAWFGFRKI